MLKNGLHTPSGWNYPLSHCNTQHMSHSCLPAGTFAADSGKCTAMYRHSLFSYFYCYTVHAGSKPYATQKTQKTGCKYI